MAVELDDLPSSQLAVPIYSVSDDIKHLDNDSMKI